MSPVRAADRGRYPADWPQISAAIRFGRAGGQCECAGECGTGHAGRCEARHGQAHPVTGSLVVLTTGPPRSRARTLLLTANLFAACQRCHLAYDSGHHAVTRARTRRARITAGMESLPGPWPEAASTGGPV